MIVVSGTPQNVAVMATQISGNIGTLFGTIKGVAQSAHSKTFGIVGFLFFVVMFIILIYVLIFFGPIIAAIIRSVLNIINTVKP